MERAATLLWWALLVACALGLWAANAVVRGGGTGEAPREFSGRFALGAARAFGPQASAKVLEGFDDLRRADRLRMVPVIAEIAGPERAREELERLRGAAPDPDFEILWRIYAEASPPLPDEDFVRRNGWFGRLALSHGLPDDHPLRREVLERARRTFVGSTIGVLGALAALVAGIVLLPLGLSALRQGRIRFAYEPPPRAAGDRCWLETATILLAGVIAVALLGRPWMWALVLVPLWPLARGFARAEWRAGLGLTRGRGVVREVGAGLVGYLAGMPVFAAGVVATFMLAEAFGEPVSHPSMDGPSREGALHLLLSACVWAPLVEEAVFRGAFHRYLRPRLPRVAAVALNGLVFAFVHPQGLVAIPALMGAGGWFAILREWRGSLVPCIAAHAVHNLALVSLAILVLR